MSWTLVSHDRGDDLNDLAEVDIGGGEHTSKRKGLGPKTKC